MRTDLASAAELITMELRRMGAKAEGERALFRDVLDDIVVERSRPAEILSRLQTLGLSVEDEVKVLVGSCRSPRTSSRRPRGRHSPSQGGCTRPSCAPPTAARWS
ncbi:hypothetical protein [Leucobacter soli]|uniref:hypothetical protein n=1 Tax=Leucobacter soli TaxID=2812850 RepID=UPI0036087BD2